MSRANALPANPAPAAESTQREPSRIQPRPYSFSRPFPKLPEKWHSPQAQDQLLHEWLIARQSIPDFAVSRGLTVDQLFDWLHSEEIVDRRKRMEHMATQRAESLARLNLPDAIGTLAATMRDENALPKERRLAASAIVRAVARADKEAERATGPKVRRRTRADEETPPHPAESHVIPGPRATGQTVLGLASAESTDNSNPTFAPPPGSTGVSVVRTSKSQRRSAPNPAAKPTLAGIARRNRAATSPPPRRRSP